MNTIVERLAAWNKNMNDVPRKLLIIAAVTLCCFCAVKIFPYFWPFVLALFFSSLMEPIAKLLRRVFGKIKAARSLATLICMLLLFGLITALFLTTADRLVREIINFIKALPDMLSAVTNGLTDWLRTVYEDYRELLPEGFMDQVNKLLSNFVSTVVSWATNLSGKIASFTISTATSLPTIILSVLFTIMGTFYLSYDRDRIRAFFHRTFPTHVVKEFGLIKSGVFTAIFGQIRAQIFISFVLMCIVIVGLSFLGKPYALLLGIIIGLADVMPVIGAGLILNTWAIGSLVFADYRSAIGLFVIYLCTITTRQIIEPRIVGKQLGLYPLVTMMSMFAGFQILGAIGLIAGPLVANICRVTLDADAGRLGPQKPVETPFTRWWSKQRAALKSKISK